MAEYTQNYNLYKPNRNDPDPVDTTLTTNFQTIDEEIKKRETDISNLTTNFESKTTELDTKIDSESQNIQEQLNTRTTMLQDQVDSLVVNGDSSPAIAQALAGTPYSTLKEKHDAVDLQFAQIAKTIQNESQLISALNENAPMKLTVGKNIDITTNLTIPRQITVIFKENGKFTVKSGVTLTFNGVIEAGYYQIFEFEDDASIITATRVSWGHSGESNPMNGGYTIKPDWFGAKPDGAPSPAYNSDGYGYSPIGTDSTIAFKRCMKFVEDLSNYYYRDVYANVPTVVVSLRPMSGYVVKGDNPLGIQGNDNTRGYMIHFEGNRSVILWEPLTQTDALFKKYGRVKYPRIENLNVLLCTSIGNRWGTFITSKTGEGDASHSWTQGVFRNILLGSPYGKAGFNIIFDIGIDGAHTMDDQTLVENVQCTTYNKYLVLNNHEAVDWKISKVMFASGTDNAVHIEIGDGFSGGLTIDSCEILMRQTGETFLKTGDNLASTPIRIINGRMETRESNAWVFIDALSGNIAVNNLQFQSGNSAAAPNIATRSAKVGSKAHVIFEHCGLYDQFDVTVAAVSGQKHAALAFNQCYFTAYIRGTVRALGYPTINYINAGTAKTIAQIIKSGIPLRKIVVENPVISDGGFNLPIVYSTYSSNLSHYKTEIFKLRSDGNPTLFVSGINSLPPNIVISDIKLFMSNIDTTKVNRVSIQIYEDKENPGGNAATVDYDIASNSELKGVSILNGDIISIPQRSYILIHQRLNGVNVTDLNLMPNAWIEISYRSISRRTDFLPTDTTIGKKSPLSSY